jgi:hypothetical protein
VKRLWRRKWPAQYPYDPRYWSDRAHPELRAAHALFINRMYFPEKGSRSTAGGRSHLPQLSLEAKQKRRELAWKAWHMRVVDGRSTRDIAVELGVFAIDRRSLVARCSQGQARSTS